MSDVSIIMQKMHSTCVGQLLHWLIAITGSAYKGKNLPETTPIQNYLISSNQLIQPYYIRSDITESKDSHVNHKPIAFLFFKRKQLITNC